MMNDERPREHPKTLSSVQISLSKIVGSLVWKFEFLTWVRRNGNDKTSNERRCPRLAVAFQPSIVDRIGKIPQRGASDSATMNGMSIETYCTLHLKMSFSIVRCY